MNNLDPGRNRDSEMRCIMIFWSTSLHFETAVRNLRARFPNANLIAVAPLSRTESLSAAAELDDVIGMSKEKLSIPADLGECVRLIRAIRKAKCDLFVTLFDSRALNMLQSLARSRKHSLYNSRGELIPLKIGPFYPLRLLWGGLWRNILGRIAYAIMKLTLLVWRVLPRRTR